MSSLPPMLASPTGIGTQHEGRKYMQIRTGRFGLVVGLVGFSFLAIRLAIAAVAGHLEELAHPATYFHAAGSAAFLLLWIATWKSRLSIRFVEVAELLTILTATFCYLAMGSYLPLELEPHLIVLLVLTVGVFARAVWVPSSATRTFVIGAAIGVVLVAWVYVLLREQTPQGIASFGESFGEMDAETFAAYTAAVVAVWWMLTVVLTAAASATIFGLRRETQLARRLGQYTLTEKLGEGGMGKVYRARHVLLRRPTAIKILNPEKAGVTALKRFEREVQLTSQLTHPNTVNIYDYGRTPDGLFYYVMELLEGATLERIVELDGAQDPARVVHILKQIAGSLHEAHERGLVHRDIKPNNIMLVEQGGFADVVKVVDFGLVKELSRDVGTRISQADAITGTPQYLPPEAIISPDDVDSRSDLYALGCVAYYLLTGQHVFSGKTIVEVCTHHLHDAPVPPSERLGAPVPAPVEALVLALLEKKADDRPRSAQEVLDRLGACAVDVPHWSQTEARNWWTSARARFEDHLATTQSTPQEVVHSIEAELGRQARLPLFQPP